MPKLRNSSVPIMWSINNLESFSIRIKKGPEKNNACIKHFPNCKACKIYRRI
jgi:hypothetical protein